MVLIGKWCPPLKVHGGGGWGRWEGINKVNNSAGIVKSGSTIIPRKCWHCQDASKCRLCVEKILSPLFFALKEHSQQYIIYITAVTGNSFPTIFTKTKVGAVYSYRQEGFDLFRVRTWDITQTCLALHCVDWQSVSCFKYWHSKP